ncbi:Detected protein of unknown function [Hibiscus syriacus]|uniref:Proline-rich protein PRCC n=1 Tax=Hibiscus syriacus TaxID=106335 RepID=A0A6A2Y4C5_HIBSY|nr:uncharacterized protein LOC120161915 [Hibiscus syriacus]XP_039028051.1 uncharacterized protein LOC120161915 [Hibiscus syriacus]KAE8678810.1 Detected protein of unknown function [Hibiscus syriacus]
MESLLANYASDDDEEPQQITHPPQTKNPSLPPPKSYSLFSSLPQPNQPLKSFQKEDGGGGKVAGDIPKPSIPNPKNTSKLFSHLPQPKSQTPQPQQPPNPPIAKRIVQFKPPINPTSHIDSDDDDDAEEEERRKRRESENLSQGPSVRSFLSSIPAPRNSTTLGVAPSSGSGRRSIIETTQVPTWTSSTFEDKSEASINHNAPNYSNYDMDTDANAGNSMNYANYQSSSDQNSGNYSDQSIGHYVNYADYSSYQSNSDPNVGNSDVATTYGSYESYGNYHAQYENNWADGSATTILPDSSGMAELGVKVKGKRGRNDIPTEIVEVKQDELMKNRPREDQVKMTGIAFGPSYQPASSKGKPNKLHKRKHQIGSLYFDMKQKEMELQERRSRGLLTKAETQAKYGW